MVQSLATLLAVMLAAPGEAETLFEKEIRPLLLSACGKCHGPTKQHGGLRVDDRRFLLQGGDSGPALIPGDSERSLLLQAVRHEGDREMPPQKKLTAHQIAALMSWVKTGAVWPEGEKVVAGLRQGPPTPQEHQFWSWQPIRQQAVPEVVDRSWPLTRIDRFVLARLEAEGLRPVAEADRRSLMRRLTLDLTGLPPTPAEVDAFEADIRPDAYEHLIERLLASPAYGERWGRHWLDVVRYADTAGDGADYPIPEAYRYRDYVISCFNNDVPFDRFVREQIAGDILAHDQATAGTISPERYAELITATGYIATTKRYSYNLKPDFQHLDLADTIDNLGTTFLGMTIGCARCHDHKFDPLTAADYYALYGIFAGTRYAFPGGEELKRPKQFPPLVLPTEAARLEQEHQAALATLDAEASALTQTLAQLLILANTVASPGHGIIAAVLTAGQGPTFARYRDNRQERARKAEQQPYPVAYAVSDDKPTDVQIHKRGEPGQLGPVVPRRFLEVFGGQPVADPKVGSGRRDLGATAISTGVFPWFARKKTVPFRQ